MTNPNIPSSAPENLNRTNRSEVRTPNTPEEQNEALIKFEDRLATLRQYVRTLRAKAQAQPKDDPGAKVLNDACDRVEKAESRLMQDMMQRGGMPIDEVNTRADELLKDLSRVGSEPVPASPTLEAAPANPSRPSLITPVPSNRNKENAHKFAHLPEETPEEKMLATFSNRQKLKVMGELLKQAENPEIHRRIQQMENLRRLLEGMMQVIDDPQMKTATFSRFLVKNPVMRFLQLGTNTSAVEAMQKTRTEILHFLEFQYPSLYAQVERGNKTVADIVQSEPLLRNATAFYHVDFSETEDDEALLRQTNALFGYLRNTGSCKSASALAEYEFSDDIEVLKTTIPKEKREEINKIVRGKMVVWINNHWSEHNEAIKEGRIGAQDLQDLNNAFEESVRDDLLTKEALRRLDASKLTGEKKRLWEQYDSMEKVQQWGLKDSTWDMIYKEVLINAPLIMGTGAAGGAVRGLLSSGAKTILGKVIIRRAIREAAKKGITVVGEVGVKELAKRGGAAVTRWAGDSLLRRGSLWATGKVVEGAAFEAIHSSITDQLPEDLPAWGKRVAWSAATLGLFEGAGRLSQKAFTKPVLDRFGKPLMQEGKVVMKDTLLGEFLAKRMTNKAARETAEWFLLKGYTEAACMMFMAAAQNGAATGNLDEFFENFGMEMFRSFISAGSLKLGHAGLKAGNKVFTAEGKSINDEANKPVQRSEPTPHDLAKTGNVQALKELVKMRGVDRSERILLAGELAASVDAQSNAAKTQRFTPAEVHRIAVIVADVHAEPALATAIDARDFASMRMNLAKRDRIADVVREIVASDPTRFQGEDPVAFSRKVARAQLDAGLAGKPPPPPSPPRIPRSSVVHPASSGLLSSTKVAPSLQASKGKTVEALKNNAAPETLRRDQSSSQLSNGKTEILEHSPKQQPGLSVRSFDPADCALRVEKTAMTFEDFSSQVKSGWIQREVAIKAIQDALTLIGNLNPNATKYLNALLRDIGDHPRFTVVRSSPRASQVDVVRAAGRVHEFRQSDGSSVTVAWEEVLNCTSNELNMKRNREHIYHDVFSVDSPYAQAARSSSPDHYLLRSFEEYIASVLTDSINTAKKFSDKVSLRGVAISNRSNFEAGTGPFIRLPADLFTIYCREAKVGNWQKIYEMRRFITSRMVHEAAHSVRIGLGITEEGGEIATHAIQFLSVEGNSRFLNSQLASGIESVRYGSKEKYDVAMNAAMKVVFLELHARAAQYGFPSPKTYYPDDLQQTIALIPVSIKPKILQEINQKIVAEQEEALFTRARNVSDLPPASSLSVGQLFRTYGYVVDVRGKPIPDDSYRLQRRGDQWVGMNSRGIVNPLLHGMHVRLHAEGRSANSGTVIPPGDYIFSYYFDKTTCEYMPAVRPKDKPLDQSYSIDFSKTNLTILP